MIFGVRDGAVDCFISPPLFMRSKGEAIRAFTDACQNGEHEFNKHAKDYEMFFLGEFDDRSGVFVSSAGGPVSVIRAVECVKVIEGS